MVFKCKCAGVYLCINIERYVNIQICYNSLMRKGYVNLCLSVFAFVQWGRLIQQFYSSLVLRRPGPRPKTTKKRLNGHRFRELESTATYPSFWNGRSQSCTTLRPLSGPIQISVEMRLFPHKNDIETWGPRHKDAFFISGLLDFDLLWPRNWWFDYF